MLKFDWLCQHSGRRSKHLAHVTRRIFPSLPPPPFPRACAPRGKIRMACETRSATAQTDRQTHRTTTVTLAAHARRGLNMCGISVQLLCNNKLHKRQCCKLTWGRPRIRTVIIIINPRRACATRVTVVDVVDMYMSCVSVCLSLSG